MIRLRFPTAECIFEWWNWNIGWRLHWRRADMDGLRLEWKA